MSERTDSTMVGASLWAGTRTLMGGARSPSNSPSRSASPRRIRSRRASKQARMLSSMYCASVATANSERTNPTQPSEALGSSSLHTGHASRALALPLERLEHLARGVARVGIGVVRGDRGERALARRAEPGERVGGVAPHPPREIARAGDEPVH